MGGTPKNKEQEIACAVKKKTTKKQVKWQEHLSQFFDMSRSHLGIHLLSRANASIGVTYIEFLRQIFVANVFYCFRDVRI